MYIHRTSVEIIKIALAAAQYYSIRCKDVLLGTTSWLRERYEATGNETFLHKAVQHIYAYIELGFPFQDHIDEFRVITDYLGKPLEELFPEEIWKYTKIKLTKTAIHDLLGNWNSRLQSMKVADVINDIYDNVTNMREGEYLYHSGKMLTQDNADILWEHTFILYIQAEEAIFHDVIKNKYYVFE